MAEALEPVFAALRERMLRSSSGMTVSTDEPGNVVLKASWTEPGKKDLAWFGAVQLKKNYVSCHLMPLYAVPMLLENVPAELRKRMQGKSCFNFKKVEPRAFRCARTGDCEVRRCLWHPGVGGAARCIVAGRPVVSTP